MYENPGRGHGHPAPSAADAHGGSHFKKEEVPSQSLDRDIFVNK